MQEDYITNRYPFKVSVITPVYNGQDYIEETITSVKNQTYLNWEMIIVDDFSSDNTVRLVKKHMRSDSRIKLIQLEKNGGPANARNIAIAAAKGRFIAFLDADDLWKKDKLEKQIEFMLQNKIYFSYTYYELMTQSGTKLDKMIRVPISVTYNALLRDNIIGCLTAVYDAQVLGKVYMPLIKKRQDYGLWLRLLKKTAYARCLPESLAYYRIVNRSISSKKIDLLKYNYLLFRRYEKLPRLLALFFLLSNIIHKILKDKGFIYQ